VFLHQAQRDAVTAGDIMLAHNLVLLEVKASRTVYPEAAKHLRGLADSAGQRIAKCIVVHAADNDEMTGTTLTTGVKAMAAYPTSPSAISARIVDRD
jgi:hypothetical protein